MQVEQVDFVSVPTRDYERAVAWYRDVLGLSESEFSDAEIEAPNLTHVLILHRRYAPKVRRDQD